MPGSESLHDQVRRERERADRESGRADHQRRRGNVSYGLMVVSVIGVIVTGYLWFNADSRANELERALSVAEKTGQQRLEDQAADYEYRLDMQEADYERQLAREKRINDVYSERTGAKPPSFMGAVKTRLSGQP
ncbi:MAG: hypothetical protein HRU39_08935 [Salinicola sp.]|uniref:hypothetical protein n=1 Tax=Salinicola sp. TaxID=1978524 RepID=UPI001D48BBD2|nr:hypothetical protein [Salinicola sp.]NRB56086.1 hypothetical protein [Salinicola sp.]